jgi:hypothetical protein
MTTFDKIEQNGKEWFGKRYHELTTYEKGVIFYKEFQQKGVTNKMIGDEVKLSEGRVGVMIGEVVKEVELCRNKGFGKVKKWTDAKV